jgi:ABC-type Fe2+-enterobactin transport system substrate-binding protein
MNADIITVGHMPCHSTSRLCNSVVARIVNVEHPNSAHRRLTMRTPMTETPVLRPKAGRRARDKRRDVIKIRREVLTAVNRKTAVF